MDAVSAQESTEEETAPSGGLHGFAEAPVYNIDIEPSSKLIKVVFNGVTIAQTRRAKVLRETRLSPVFYLPREDVRMDLLSRSDHLTHCPFKGNATYWNLEVGDQIVENVAWSYDDALPEAIGIKGHLAFYQNKVDSLFEAESEISIDPAQLAHRHSNPFVDWLMREAWEAADSKELVQRLAQRLREQGVPLWRMNLLIGTLNPQVAGNSYVWALGADDVDVRTLRHDAARSDAFRNSPLIPIYEGRGGVRRRLEGPDPVLDFPILKDLKEAGATDYVAMPITFSDGHINVITLAADRAGGFSTSDLGQIYEVLPLLSRLFEVQALRRSTQSLLRTYLGQRTGDLVLNGQVRRGDGENIPAVIWYSDLRNSTALADRLPRETYLSLLNAYFDGAAGAVEENGGEVLKFIGDAVLGIFPIQKCVIQTAGAAKSALTAAQVALERLDQAKDLIPADASFPVQAGISLHLGDVTYGNVGSQDRLDFTVIGPAANQVVRQGDLCKVLGHPILASSAFVEHLPESFVSLGDHHLRGLPGTHEIFTLSPQNTSSQAN
ncbi:MAG: DUF427 domain-containing protein [Pseudomonadota bacterium]